MTKEIEEAINKIIQIPNDFHAQKNESPVTLLKESGYCELHEQISVDSIIAILKVKRQFITDWLQWSDDQRFTPTTYFTKGEEWCFIGHSPENKDFMEINTKDACFACAFIYKTPSGTNKKLIISQVLWRTLHTTTAFKQLGQDVGAMSISSFISSAWSATLKPGICKGNEHLVINSATVRSDVTQNAPPA